MKLLIKIAYWRGWLAGLLAQGYETNPYLPKAWVAGFRTAGHDQSTDFSISHPPFSHQTPKSSAWHYGYGKACWRKMVLGIGAARPSLKATSQYSWGGHIPKSYIYPAYPVIGSRNPLDRP